MPKVKVDGKVKDFEYTQSGLKKARIAKQAAAKKTKKPHYKMD